MTTLEILEKLATGKLTVADASALLPKQAPAKPLYPKVSNGGGLSVYGLQRMPVTLSPAQWARLADFMAQVLEFAKANEGQFRAKGESAEDYAKRFPARAKAKAEGDAKFKAKKAA